MSNFNNILGRSWQKYKAVDLEDLKEPMKVENIIAIKYHRE